MIYTTYISKMDKIPKKAIKILIVRYPPKDFNVLKYEKLYFVSALAPSISLLNSYKNSKQTDEDWKKYVTEFVNEMTVRQDMIDAIKKVARLAKDMDVYLICYEKDYTRCHRTILAKYIEKLYNIKYKEF